MKILILIPVFRRPEILALFVKHMEQTLCPYAELWPVFIVSPQDQTFRQITTILQGYETFIADNEPLGAKKNKGLEYCLTTKWDYLMDMGSDDIWTGLLWELYKPYFDSLNPFFGMSNLYAYNSLTGEAVHVPGYHLNHFDEISAIGPGRCIRRDVVMKNFPLWNSEAPFGMDGYSDKKIQDSGVKVTVIDNGRLPVICDIKSGVCLTAWEDLTDRCDVVSSSWLKDVFGIWDISGDISTFSGFSDNVQRLTIETRTKREAFDVVNRAYEEKTGELRFANYATYRVMESRKNKKYGNQKNAKELGNDYPG